MAISNSIGPNLVEREALQRRSEEKFTYRGLILSLQRGEHKLLSARVVLRDPNPVGPTCKEIAISEQLGAASRSKGLFKWMGSLLHELGRHTAKVQFDNYPARKLSARIVEDREF